MTTCQLFYYKKYAAKGTEPLFASGFGLPNNNAGGKSLKIEPVALHE
jgi:hypothetical protein